jgi:hypothetical protein
MSLSVRVVKNLVAPVFTVMLKMPRLYYAHLGVAMAMLGLAL